MITGTMLEVVKILKGEKVCSFELVPILLERANSQPLRGFDNVSGFAYSSQLAQNSNASSADFSATAASLLATAAMVS